MMTDRTTDVNELLARNQILIGDRWLDATSAGTVAHTDPSTGRVVGEAHIAGAREIDLAVSAARSAQKAWMALLSSRRAALLHRFADELERHAKTLGDLLALDAGVPISLGIGMASAWVRHYAGYADKVTGSAADASTVLGFHVTRREPYGVVGVIIPWNHPLIAICQVAIPAIAAGNAVVLKPPSLTPYTALKVGELALAAGWPPGLLNVLPGDAEAGDALIRHRGVSKISFTGGGATARHVMASAAQVLKPVFLELGGKSANLVFADAALEAQVPFSACFAMGLSGQGCVLPTRMLVESSVYDAVVEGAAKSVACMKIGPAIDPATMFGPVIDARACERILGVIERTKSTGEGRLVCGGRRVGGALADGYFIEPTIFADVDPKSRLAREEVFGPVLAISRFDTEQQAVEIANDSEFGLGAYVQTGSLARAHRLAAQLEAGYVNINGFSNMEPAAPFGGYKQSGFGRFGGQAGLDEYLQTKTVFFAG